MKKISFTLVLLSLFLVSVVKSQDVISESTNYLATNIVNALKGKKIPKSAKIAVLYFTTKRGNNDTAKTEIGISVAKELEYSLTQKNAYTILVTNEQVLSESQKYFLPPAEHQAASDYYTKFLNGITPDYFVVGSYSIQDKNFILSNVYIRSRESNNSFAVQGAEAKITSQADVQNLLEKPQTLEKLAENLAYQLKFHNRKRLVNLRVENITAGINCGNTSEFGFQFTELLKEKLIQICKYEIRDVAMRGLFDENRTPHTLTGYHYEENGKVKIRLTLLNDKKSKLQIAVVEGEIPRNVVTVQTDVAPNNIGPTSLNNVNTIINNLNTNSQELKLEIATNKGNANPFFYEGDFFALSVKANKPCFVRVIDFLSDGTPTLLKDNFEIPQEKVGQTVEIFSGKCASPFGPEILYVSASTEKYPPLRTESKDGYNMIKDSVKDLLSSTNPNFRGFKSEQSDYKINVTTAPKKK